MSFNRLLLWVAALLACLASLHAGAAPAPLRGAWLDQDLPADTVPAAQAPLLPLSGNDQAVRLTLPFRDHGTWVRLQPQALQGSAVLLVETAVMPTVTLVLPDGSRLQRSKVQLSPDGQGMALAMSFPLPAGLQSGDVLWVHFADRVRASVTLSLLDAADWQRRERHTLVRLTALCSLLAAFAVIGFGFWVVLRERLFAFYTLHLLTLLLFIAAGTGLLDAWPGGSLWTLPGVRTQWALGAWTMGLAVAFARDFLGVRRTWPRLSRVFGSVALGLVAAGAVVLLPLDWPWFGAALSASMLSVHALLIITAVVLARRGSRYARYFLAGWVPLALAGSLRGLQGMGLITTPGVSVFYGLGVLCEALMLALGLADQMLSVRRERDHALQAAGQTRQLELQNETLRENVRLREQVDRMSRHDLKTPLGSVVSIPRMVAELGPLNPEQQRLLRHVERAGYRALNMVNLSLDLLKMEQGTYDWQPAAVDLSVVLLRVRADLATLEAAHGVSVTQQPATDMRPVVLGEETLCYSILANLLKNAVEAAPSGSEVRVWFDTVEPGWVGVHIYNEGAVPLEVRPRFFEKYASHGKPDGTGFGTYSARLMARMQQGDVLLRTSEAEGTTVILRQRTACAEEWELPDSAPASLPMPLEASDALPRLAVLLVDDDEYNLLALRRCFPVTGVELHTASHGRDALQMLGAQAFDAVFLDLEMPGMSGFEVAQALRRHEELSEPPAFVVALSSHEEPKIRQQALAAGFDRYACKPIEREAVRQLLREAAQGAARQWAEA